MVFSGIRNRLLATLPPSDFELLAPELETVALDHDAVLSRAGDQIKHVFFPDSGAISLMIDMTEARPPPLWSGATGQSAFFRYSGRHLRTLRQ